MMRPIGWLWVAVWVIFAAAPARAAGVDADAQGLRMTVDGDQDLSLNLGIFHPTAKFGFRGVAGDKGERFGANGFAWAADYLHQVSGPLSLGAEFAYMNRGEYSTTNVTAGTPSTTIVRGDTMLMLALVRLRMSGTGWRPYVVGGAGFHRTSFDLLLTNPGLSETPIVRGQETGLALAGRVGLDYMNAKGGFAGFEAGYIHTAAMSIQPTAYGAGVGYKNVDVNGDGLLFSLKFGVRFGAGS